MNRNEGCFIIIFLVTVIMLVMLALAFDYITGLISCNVKASALGYKCEYNLFSGCVLTKSNGKKVLLEQLRDFEGE